MEDWDGENDDHLLDDEEDEAEIQQDMEFIRNQSQAAQIEFTPPHQFRAGPAELALPPIRPLIPVSPHQFRAGPAEPTLSPIRPLTPVPHHLFVQDLLN